MVWNRRKWFRSNGTYSIMDYIQENSRKPYLITLITERTQNSKK